MHLEHVIEAALPLEPFGDPIAIHSRLARLARLADGTAMIADYKTSGRIAGHASILDALKGTRLQMALYVLLAESEAGAGGHPPAVRAEVLGVGPFYEDATEKDRRAAVDPEKFARARDGILETIATLRALAERGLFPLDETSGLCRFCPFTRACRKDHAPTLERWKGRRFLDAWAPAGQDHSRPTLAQVSAAGIRWRAGIWRPIWRTRVTGISRPASSV
jgi:hypothetical protein